MAPSGRTAASGRAVKAPAPQMGRYRAYGAFYERYWSRLFSVTQADLDLLEALVTDQEPAQAATLTSMVRAVVDVRLRRGPRLDSTPARDVKMADPLVRRWDPEASWAAGDRAIFVVPDLDRVRGFSPRLGQLLQVGSDHVLARVDGRSAPEVYALGPMVRNQPLISAEARMAALADEDDAGSCVDDVIWRFGGIVVGRVLAALRADQRFVELEGLWSLRELVRSPNERDLVEAARVLFGLRVHSLTLDALLSHALPGTAVATPARFGWVLAMEEHPELFVRVATLPKSRWALAGPPPIPLVARHAAYDPETYEVLCTAGSRLVAETARRLWDCGLLYAALGTPDPAEESASAQAEPARGAARGHSTPSRSAWWRRLSLSRH